MRFQYLATVLAIGCAANTDPASDGTSGTHDSSSADDAAGDNGATTDGSADDSGGADSAFGDTGPGGSDTGMVSTDAGPTWKEHCGAMGAPVLTGQVLAPDGVEPVPVAAAYIVSLLKPIVPGVACDLCLDTSDGTSAGMVTDIDGRFKLDLSSVPYAPTLQLAVRKGRFRKVSMITPTCGTMAVPKPQSTLPGNVSAGDLPKIGVSTGNSDHLDNMLLALGITSFDCYEGRVKTGAICPAAQATGKKVLDLLKDSTTLNKYNLLFVSCAPDIWSSYSAADRATIVKNLGDWAKAGGRFIATDQSYDYVSQTWPTQITWQGPAMSASGWEIGTLAGKGANLGDIPASGMTYPGTVDDVKLTAWLKLPEIGVTSAPSVTIAGWRSAWSVQKSLDATTTREVHGTVDYGMPRTTADLPLTSEFVVNKCGKVIYSSYHTDTGGTTMLSQQERILEYLILDSAGCLN